MFKCEVQAKSSEKLLQGHMLASVYYFICYSILFNYITKAKFIVFSRIILKH